MQSTLDAEDPIVTAGYSLGELTLVALSGKDRDKILNNLCTQDLRHLVEGQVTETFVLDVKGRTLSHGVVAARPTETWFLSTLHQGPRLVPHIDRYILREDAVVTDLSSQWHAYLVRSGTVLAKDCLQEAVDSAHGASNRGSDARCGSIADGEEEIVWIHVPWMVGGAELFLTSTQASGPKAQRLATECETNGLSQRAGWDLERIQAFWPWYGVDCDEKNLPQELAIDDRTISFKKGCYLGQETVARLDALGQVQKRLAILEVDGTETLELPFRVELDGKEIAVITSLVETPEGRRQGLAMIRRSHFEPGSRFLVGSQWGTVLPRP
ncbi:MAG: hypothetical protein WCI02_08370 [Planctomycetota bacterium]